MIKTRFKSLQSSIRYSRYWFHKIPYLTFLTKTVSDIPILPDADENIDADLLYSVKPAELHSRT